MFKSIIFFSLLTTTFAGAVPMIQGIPDGSYLGEFKGQREGKVNLIVKGYGGCQGCFVGIFVVDPNQSFFGKRGTPEIVAYSGVPHTLPTTLTPAGATTDQYDLTPIGIDLHDGKLTIPNADPTYTLGISKNAGDEDVQFSIVSANDKMDKLGLGSGMLFSKERKSKITLSSPFSGHYKSFGGSDNFLTMGTVLTNSSDTARSGPVNWSGDFRTTSGHFILKEQLPNVYSFTQVSTLASGDTESEVPNFLTFFLEKKGEKMAVLVNIGDRKDARRYDLDDYNIPNELVVKPAPAITPVTSTSVATVGLPVGSDSLEYPGSPTSYVTPAQVEALKGWAVKAKLEIMRIRRKISGVISDQEKKDILVEKITKLAGDLGVKGKDPSLSDFNTKDLLVRQSLYTGLVLVRVIDYAREKRGPTAGEISEEVDILLKAMSFSENYSDADQAYMTGMVANPGDYVVNDGLIKFGKDLSEYITSMSTRMRPLNLLASYGAIRWSLGVLNRKILDDNKGKALLGNTALFLVNELNNFPEMETMALDPNVNDATLAVKIQELKKLYLEIQSEIKVAEEEAAKGVKAASDAKAAKDAESAKK